MSRRSRRPHANADASCRRTGRARRAPPQGGAGRERPVAHDPDAYASGRSDIGIVPVNPPNNACQPAAEVGEGRPVTKGSSVQLTKSRAQDWTDVSYKLDWVREAARKDRGKRFTRLLHHLTPRLLLDSFRALRKDAASGVDEVTCAQYAEGLAGRLSDLHDRVHSGRYRAKPSKRIYIEKDDGRLSSTTLYCQAMSALTVWKKRGQEDRWRWSRYASCE
jgi:hypothetical protein